MGTHLHRGLGDTEQLGDLLEREPLEAMEHDGLPLILRQLRKRCLDRASQARVGQGRRLGGSVGELIGGMRLLPPVAPEVIPGGVDCHRVEPGPKRSALQVAAPGADDGEEGRLEDVTRGRSDHAPQRSLEAGCVPSEQLGKGLLISLDESLHQLLIGLGAIRGLTLEGRDRFHRRTSLYHATDGASRLW